MPEIPAVPAAVLARIAVPGEQERVGDLPAQATRNVYVANQADHHGCRKFGRLRSERTILVHFQGFRLAIYHEAEGPADRYDRQRLERRVECETTHGIESTSYSAAAV